MAIRRLRSMIREIMRKRAKKIFPKRELRIVKSNSPIEDPNRVIMASYKVA